MRKILFGMVLLLGTLHPAGKVSAQEFITEITEIETEPVTIHEDITVLFIGNSITFHEYLPGTWEGEWGMAATEEAKDYVHVAAAQLNEIFDSADVYLHKLSYWESPVAGTVRSDYMFIVQEAIKETEPDVVVLQLGENVSDAGSFIGDYMYLIETIRAAAPEAKLLMIGEVLSDWDEDGVEISKQSIADYYGIPYIDTTEIRDNPDYQARVGDTYVGRDGELYTIEKEGVAHHLSDTGMEWLATRVTEAIAAMYGDVAETEETASESDTDHTEKRTGTGAAAR